MIFPYTSQSPRRLGRSMLRCCWSRGDHASSSGSIFLGESLGDSDMRESHRKDVVLRYRVPQS